MSKWVRLYTDGACSGNQSDENIGGWGAVLEYGKHMKTYMAVKKYHKQPNGNDCIEALKCLKKSCRFIFS